MNRRDFLNSGSVLVASDALGLFPNLVRGKETDPHLRIQPFPEPERT
jgi:hypothetical protein